MNEADWMDQAAAYALGALPPDERATFEARLAEDADLRAEVAEFERLVGELGRLAVSEEPPAGLRERVLARAAAARPVRTAPSAMAAPPRRSALPLWIGWGLAAAALVLSFGLWNAQVTLQSERAVLRAEYERALGDLAAADSAIADRDAVLDAIRAGDVRSADLAGVDGGTAARVFYDPSGGWFAVLAARLPPTPAGRTYQLWAIAEGAAPVSVGTFDVREGGATVRIEASQAVRDLGDLTLAALTVEPEGGSPQPTETPRYLGSWRSPGASSE